MFAGISNQGRVLGKERTVLVTHTPASAHKQAYTFADKLEAMRQEELLAMRAKVETKPRSGGTRKRFASGMSDFVNRSTWIHNYTIWNSASPPMACR